MQLIDGKLLSKTIKEEIRLSVETIKQSGGKIPHLAAVLVGDDGASQAYVNGKVRSCEQVGFTSTLIREDAGIRQKDLLGIIDKLNHDEDIDGFIVQLPLPAHIHVDSIIQAIAPEKDVDGFHPVNLGRMVAGLPCYLPATPFGILTMLERYHIDTVGKECVILGRSNIVGTPLSILLSRNRKPGNCTVSLCHSRTQNLKEKASQADILIAALGKPGFVEAAMVKEGAVVIDVGISRVADATSKRGYRLKGDVDFESVAPKCSFITPVPGGVGPMTITSLLMNTLKAASKEIYQ